MTDPGSPRQPSSGLPDADAQPDGRDETGSERADRNFNDVLQELRVAQTGVQILFAFLLTLPFTQRFSSVQPDDRVIYIGTVIVSAIAMACLVAPVSYHRIMFARGMKRQIVQSASRLASAGLAFLFLAVIGALYLIIDVVVNATLAATLSGLMAALFLTLWYIFPLYHRSHQRSN